MVHYQLRTCVHATTVYTHVSLLLLLKLVGIGTKIIHSVTELHAQACCHHTAVKGRVKP